MQTTRRLTRLVVILGVVLVSQAQLNSNEAQATQFLEDLDPRYLTAANAQMLIRWNYITNVTDENSNAAVSLLTLRSQIYSQLAYQCASPRWHAKNKHLYPIPLEKIINVDAEQTIQKSFRYPGLNANATYRRHSYTKFPFSFTQVEADGKFFDFQKATWDDVKQYDFSGFNDATVKREFQYLNIIGPAALNSVDAQRVLRYLSIAKKSRKD